MLTPQDSIILLKHHLASIGAKVDSLAALNKELVQQNNEQVASMGNHSSSSNGWFFVVFALVVLIALVLYWAITYSYFKKQINEIDTTVKNTRNQLVLRIANKEKGMMDKMSVDLNNLTRKMQHLENRDCLEVSEAIENRINRLETAILSPKDNHVHNGVSTPLDITQEIRDDIFVEFFNKDVSEKRELLFKTRSLALIWLLPMLEYVVKKQDQNAFQDLAQIVFETVEKCEFDETFEQQYKYYVRMLIDIESYITNAEDKKFIKKIKLLLSKKYYSSVEIAEIE